jgi:hypothetical protein
MSLYATHEKNMHGISGFVLVAVALIFVCVKRRHPSLRKVLKPLSNLKYFHENYEFPGRWCVEYQLV